MTTFAVLPVKRFDGAKQRLGDAYPPGTRRALAEAMLVDVLVALRRTKGLEGVIVVTAESAAEALARGHGAQVVGDDAEAGQTDAARIGVRAAAEADRVLLVPGDCPALDPQHLTAMLSRPRSPGPEVVVVPDRHGTGTNGLLLTPPDAIVPVFGAGSCERHVRAAEAAGAACVVLEVPSLALDVDTPEDLTALRAALGAARGGAAHTRGLLARLDRTEQAMASRPPYVAEAEGGPTAA